MVRPHHLGIMVNKAVQVSGRMVEDSRIETSVMEDRSYLANIEVKVKTRSKSFCFRDQKPIDYKP